MEREQILALAEKADETATQYLQCAGEYHPDYHSVRDEHFYHAAIESYKADLLREVGEPVLYAEFAEDGGWLGDASEYADHLEEPHALFTSDQVAAAILKATKPLEEEIERLTEWEQAVVCECMACDACLDCSDPRKTVKNIREYYFTWGMEEQKTILETGLILELRDQLTKAEQLWQVAQGRCDGLEEKLAKAEQRVAEACAALCNQQAERDAEHQKTGNQCDDYISGYGDGSGDCANSIDQGEWRKFVEESDK